MNKLLFASVISDIKQSDIFMTVKARICEAPAANLNGARVTEGFIDEIIDNEERYVGLPLYADVRALTNGNYRRLGHLYDARTGEFHSTQIGSFYRFEKETFDGGCALIGYARIAKRNKKLSKALTDLWTDGALKFSFEVTVGEYTEMDDNTILIDAAESNYLEGTAIVTFPACEDAVALELVAQCKADDIEGGEKEMAGKSQLADNNVVEQPGAETKKVANAEDTNQEVSTDINAESTEVIEENASCKKEEAVKAETTPEVETAEIAEQENAAVIIRERTEEKHSTYAYDTESSVEVLQTVEVETEVSHVEPESQIVEADDGVHIAEEGGETSAESPTESTTGESVTDSETNAEVSEKNDSGDSGSADANQDSGDAAEDVPNTDTQETNKKTAEQMIAELAEIVESLRTEIAGLKEQKVNAEAKTVTAEINPLFDEIRAGGKRFSLLEPEPKIEHFTLI